MVKTSAKKRITKKARKTRRRKVAGAPGVFTEMYRKAHKGVLGKHSKGEQGEIDDAAKAAKAANAKMDADLLDKIRESEKYTEMNNIDDLQKGDTYVEYQGAHIKPNLLPLGVFKETVREPYKGRMYGNPITLKFEKKVFEGYFRTDAEMWLANNTSIKGLIFKVNSGAVIAEDKRLPQELADKIGKYGGRKRTTRKRKKSRRARK